MALNRTPPLATRAALAWRVFRSGLPWSPWGKRSGPIDAKSNPLMWPSFRIGQPTWHTVDITSFARFGFSLNSLVYSSVMYKCRAVTAAPMRAWKGDPESPELANSAHPHHKLLDRPNQSQSAPEFHQLNTVYLNIAGNVFIHLDRLGRGQLPVAMRSLRPDRVFIVPGTGGTLKGYLYIPEGRSQQDALPILPEDMIHIKLPNPLDPLEGLGYGLSPLGPCATSIDIDNDVTKFLKMFFERGANTGYVLKYNIPLDDVEVARARTRWMERYGGSENWGDVAVLDQQGSVERIGYTMQEMGFDSLDERNESRILGPFGVPPMLLGSRYGMERSTFSNFAEARQVFWQDTFIPELLLFEVEYRYFLTGADGVFPANDLRRVPALQKDVPKLAEAAHRLWSLGMPPALALQTVGLDVEPFPGSDIAHLPISVTPVLTNDNPVPDAMLPAPVPTELQPPAGGGSGQDPTNQNPEDGARSGTEQRTRFGMGRPPSPLLSLPPPRHGRPKAGASHSASKGLSSEASRERFHRGIDALARSWEPKYSQAADRSFRADQAHVLELLDGHKSGGLRPSSGKVAWNFLINDLTTYYRGLDAAGETWRSHFARVLDGHITEVGNHLSATFGVQFSVRDLLAEAWFNEYKLQFAQPINDTSSLELSNLLQTAQREGWDVPGTERHIRALFQQWMRGNAPAELIAWAEDRTPPHRTETIARTETIRASNTSSYRTYKDWGVPRKTWLATLDDRTREDHTAANGQTVGIDDTFTVGGHPMQYPHDPSAPADQTINCRCTVLPEFAAEAKPPTSPQPGVLAPTPQPPPIIPPEQPRVDRGADVRRKMLELEAELKARLTDAEAENDRLSAALSLAMQERSAYLLQGREPPAKVQRSVTRASKDLGKSTDKLVNLRKDNLLPKLREALYAPTSENRIVARVSGPEATPNARARAKEATTFISKVMGVYSQSQRIKFDIDFQSRPFYRSQTSTAHIDHKDDTGVYVHEGAHHIEDRHVIEIWSPLHNWLNKRTAGERTVSLKALTGRNYDGDEVTTPDRFINPYIGKRYYKGSAQIIEWQGLSEVFSMGVETLYRNPLLLARQDPDMFDTLIDVLRGNKNPGSESE